MHVVSKSSSVVHFLTFFTVVRASARLQWLTTLRAPEHLSTLVTTPLWTALYVSLSPADNFAPLAAALIGIWHITVNVAAGVIENEKWQGTLEIALSSTLPYWCILFGRVAAFAPLFAVILLEALLADFILTGRTIGAESFIIIMNALMMATIGSIGTAILLAPVFLRIRNAPVVSTALSFPLLLLGGLAVPSSELPSEITSFSKLFFMSWVTELIRAPHLSRQDLWCVLSTSWVAVVMLAVGSTILGIAILARTERLIHRRGAKEFI